MDRGEILSSTDFQTIPITQVYTFLMLIYLFSACTGIGNETITLNELKNLKNIDKVDVYYSGEGQGNLIKTFRNPEEIQEVVSAFQKYANHWKSYHPVPPHAPLSISFHNQDEVQFAIGIGNTLNKSERLYYLAQLIGYGRPLKPYEFEELIMVLGVDADLTTWK